jgi:hypothetical protein
MLLLLACTPPAPDAAAAYVAALSADTFEDAWAACEPLVDADLADCRQAVIQRFARFDRCEAVGVQPWASECRYAAAEHLARSGDRGAALAACKETTYTVNCEQHVFDGLAMSLKNAGAGEVAAAWGALGVESTGRNTELDFWRSWHRIRLDAGDPADPATCPHVRCRTALRAELRKRLGPRQRANGCDAGPGEWPAAVARLAADAWAELCRRGPPPAGIASPVGGAPVVPTPRPE